MPTNIRRVSSSDSSLCMCVFIRLSFLQNTQSNHILIELLCVVILRSYMHISTLVSVC